MQQLEVGRRKPVNTGCGRIQPGKKTRDATDRIIIIMQRLMRCVCHKDDESQAQSNAYRIKWRKLIQDHTLAR